jgi:hypothetical protein
MLVFLTKLCKLLLSKFLTGSPPPSLPPSQSQVQYIQTVCGWEGVGVLSCVGDHILQEFSALLLTRLRTYKIDLPPQTKTLEGNGPPTDKHLLQTPFTGQIF